MTTRVDLAEFLTAYLAEVDEHLSVANTRLLAIETSLGKGEQNPRAVRDLFRALHTIKGLSAMVGIEPVVAIAHRMEAILRNADRGGGALAGKALELLLEASRAIEMRVRALAEKRPVAAPPSVLLDALEALETGELAGPQARSATLDLEPALAGRLAVFEKQQLVLALEEGRRVVRLDFAPSPERAAAGQSINSVRENVSSVAEIVKVLPIASSPSAGVPIGLSFALLLVTNAADEELARVAGVALEAITPIGRPEPVSPAVAPLEALAVSAEEGTPVALPEEEPERRSVLRVEVSRVDDAMEKLAALIVSRSRLSRAVGELDAAARGARELKQIATDMARQIRDLRASILQVRMVRVSEVLERVPLVVRGLRRATGKQVRLEIDAGDAELDKAVAERLFPAILHLVRNAVDHGIEPANERLAAGKSEEGLIRIVASASSNTQLELRITDDGRGVDKVRVAARAHADVPATDDGLLELLCRPGFSTRDEVTTTSGRGMGMDIVKRVVADQLGGELHLTTQIGVGTCFVLHVPLTIAIVDAFLVECSGARFVVPVSTVEEIVEIETSRVVSAPIARSGSLQRLGMFERRGEAVPLVDLGALLHLRRGQGQATRAVIVRRGGQPVAFTLDGVLGQQEAVVRPLVDPLVSVPGVSGSTDLGDGRPTLVLDLVSLAAGGTAKLIAPPRQPPALPAERAGDAGGLSS